MSSDNLADRYPRIADVGIIDPDLFKNENDFNKHILKSLFGFYSMFGNENLDWIEEADPSNSYRLNSFGYRDPEYSGPADLIAAGCSQTFGQGVPENYRWSNMLAKKLNMSVATVAVPGWSAMGAINAAMSHIITYGKPKVVALLLPDFFRFDYVKNSKIIVDTWITENSKDDFPIRLDIGHSGHIKKYPKVSKRPHIAEEVINPETTAFLNGQILRFFLEYCKEANIKVVWTSWEGSVQELVQHIKNIEFESLEEKYQSKLDLSGYVEIDYYHDGRQNLHKLAKKNCHLNEKEKLDSSVKMYYDYASDKDNHMGIHAHMHVVDAFYKRLHRLEA